MRRDHGAGRVRSGVAAVAAMVALTAGLAACDGRGLGAASADEAAAGARAKDDDKQAAGAQGAAGADGERESQMSDEELREKLSPEQYAVCLCSDTEPPFRNKYWDHKGDGIYYDVISGAPLFDSKAKFKSGTGWPSFTAPVSADAVTLHKDESHGMVRVEVRSASSGAHLGHLFDDGPAPTGKRYCINSASLLFAGRDEPAPKPLKDR